jgi:hypothetical protein
MRQSAPSERPAGFWRVLMGGVLPRHPQKHKTPPERRGVVLGCESSGTELGGEGDSLLVLRLLPGGVCRNGIG